MGFLTKLFRAIEKDQKRKQRKQEKLFREAQRQERDRSKRLIGHENELIKECSSLDEKRQKLEKQIRSLEEKLGGLQAIAELEMRRPSLEKELSSIQKKYEKIKSDFHSILHASEVFNSYQYAGEKLILEGFDPSSFSPLSNDDLMCMQIKELRSLFRANQKEIQKLVSSYKDRYSTKVNATIYQIMVLALDAELQLILRDIGYGKLQNAIDAVKALTAKYYVITANGNQTIASTLTKFIGQLEYYYIEAVKIEYEYYVKRERAREEQRALKEQMRQEAEERRQLEAQRKKMEAEEAKYEKEMARISELITSSVESEEVDKLRAQLEKVQSQLADAQARKERIITLQNGKAGTVYIISNIGSFGENVFKIGMTRRDEPMDRVKELGDASVPFPFDVHSFIFSNDAVGLETELHHRLNDRRVNKINLRKEFFNVSIDELQDLVEKLDPSAAFNRTALAEQFRQSLSINQVPECVFIIDENE